MNKTIIKCDICNKELDKEESTYYRIEERNMPGWLSISYDFGASTQWDICKKCFLKGYKNLHKVK